jgi:hypothetical protein
MSMFSRVAWFGGCLMLALGVLSFGSGDLAPPSAAAAPQVNRPQGQNSVQRNVAQNQKKHHKHHHKHHHKGNQNRQHTQLNQQQRQELLRAENLINQALAGR